MPAATGTPAALALRYNLTSAIALDTPNLALAADKGHDLFADRQEAVCVSRLQEPIEDDGHVGCVTAGFALVGTGAGIVEDRRGVANAHAAATPAIMPRIAQLAGGLAHSCCCSLFPWWR
jgi:hypothetical protein